MKECMYYLLIQKKAATKQNTCPVPCSLVVYIFLVILLTVLTLLPSVTTPRTIARPSPFYNLDVKLSISLWRQNDFAIISLIKTHKMFERTLFHCTAFHCSSWLFQTILSYFRVCFFLFSFFGFILFPMKKLAKWIISYTLSRSKIK